jgi:xanthine phosphoribosyltransferase
MLEESFVNRRYYPYSEFLKDVESLHHLIVPFNPDTILPVARGGMVLGHFLGIIMNMRRVFVVNSIHYDGRERLDRVVIRNIPDLTDANRVLILDDIIDSGNSMKRLKEILVSKYPKIEFKVATIFYKSTASILPDYSLKEAKEWIDFFWEVDVFNFK